MPADPSRSAPSRSRLSRAAWWGAGLLAVAFLVWQALTATAGRPTRPTRRTSRHGAVVSDSAVLVLREGLEASSSSRRCREHARRERRLRAAPSASVRAWASPPASRRGSSPSGSSACSAAAGWTSRRRRGCWRSACCCRHELVLPQRLLDRLDLTPQSPPRRCSTRPTTSRGAGCCSGSRCSASRASTARASRSSCSCRTCAWRTAPASSSRASRSAWL